MVVMGEGMLGICFLFSDFVLVCVWWSRWGGLNLQPFPVLPLQSFFLP